MDTTIITNVLFTVLSIFLIIITYIFWFLISNIVHTLKRLRSLIDTTENEIEKVAIDIDNIRAKTKYSQTIFASAIMHSLSFIKKLLKK